MDRMKSFYLMLLLAIVQIAQAETIEALMEAGELERPRLPTFKKRQSKSLWR